MLISPPFLPAPLADDEAFIAAAMPDGTDVAPNSGGAPLGSYPLTTALTWHNGLHIRAPRDPQNQALPVRAIADGTVIFKREPRAAVAAADDPQNYNPYGSDPAWTDNGIVILRHTTEIGAAGTTPTTWVYYSVYMHLSRIDATVVQARTVWRKDAIGTAGRILGRENHLHFEICLDPSNLANLLGAARPARWTDPAAAPSADGRTDSVFGSVYVYLPAGTPTSTSKPTSHLRGAAAGGSASATGGQLAPGTLHDAQWVEIRYQGGSGAVRSYRATGAQAGEPFGAAHAETDFEYDMYTEACARHNSLGAALQATSSPSGWYELLRFGRNLGPDPLPANVAHWREIPTATGTVWADLHAPGTFKFSDADFPGFVGWQCFEDDTSHDNQRCDSQHMKRWLRDPQAPQGAGERRALARRLGNAEVRKKFQRAICQFPTEWDRSTIARRYDWLRTDDEFRVQEGKEWNEFKAHAESISFEGLPQEYKDAVWHLHPRMFIAHMRKCGWLKLDEMVQLIPAFHPDEPTRRIDTDIARNWLTTQGSNPRNGGARPAGMHSAINLMMRKYGFSSLLRRAHLFGQILTESDLLQTTREYGGASYFSRAYEGRCNTPVTRIVREWSANPMVLSPLGNCQAGDGEKFIGRGVIQMTGRDLYEKYGEYRGQDFSTGTKYLNVSDVAFNACDSAGQYWVKESLRDRNNARHWILRGAVNIHRDADNASFSTLSTVASLTAADADVMRLTRQINRAGYHIEWRRSFFKHSYYHLSDLVDAPPVEYRRRSL